MILANSYNMFPLSCFASFCSPTDCIGRWMHYLQNWSVWHTLGTKMCLFGVRTLPYWTFDPFTWKMSKFGQNRQIAETWSAQVYQKVENQSLWKCKTVLGTENSVSVSKCHIVLLMWNLEEEAESQANMNKIANFWNLEWQTTTVLEMVVSVYLSDE